MIGKTNVSVGGSYQLALQDKTISPTKTTQVVTADEDYDGLGAVTVNAVTSSIDSNIQASNIKSGVTILGVTGTLNTGATLPTLYAPSSITRTAGNTTFSVSNNTYNGYFVKSFKIYNEQTLVYTDNYNSIYNTTSRSYNIYNILAAGYYKLYAAAASPYFNEGPKTSTYIEFSVYGITYTLNNMTSSNTQAKIMNDISYTTTLTAANNYYLPPHINLFNADTNNLLEEDVDYIYDMYTGALSLNVTCNLNIAGSSLSTPQLKEVSFIYDEQENAVVYDDVLYAETYYLYVDDVLVETITVD